MADMLQDAAEWFIGELADNLSQSVTYLRGSKQIAGLAATKGAPRKELDTQYGILKIVGTDWIVKADLLAYLGTPWTPQKNDVIEESSGARWQVLQDNGEQEAGPSDPYGYAWRIHTKRIEVPS